MIRVSAPCRVDLAGGTLDIWPLGVLHPGARTVNVAVDLAVRVSLARRPSGYRVRQVDHIVEARTTSELLANAETALVGVVAEALTLPPAEIVLASESPRGGGLGASSAMMVALIAAAERLHGRDSPAERRAALARDLEARLMGLPTGTQDHYPALLGGALEIRHQPGGEQVRRLDVDLEELGRRLVLAYSGSSHFSAASNWQVVRRRLDGDRDSVGLFAGISEVAAEVPAALEAGDFARVGRLVGREWSFRRQLAEGISTPGIESLLEAGRDLGAWGGKACGAGGGGCVALICPPERRDSIVAALGAAGAQILAARPIAAAMRFEE